MAQIFISYSRADRAVVEALSALLTAEGYDVWWDTALESGADALFTKPIDFTMLRSEIDSRVQRYA